MSPRDRSQPGRERTAQERERDRLERERRRSQPAPERPPAGPEQTIDAIERIQAAAAPGRAEQPSAAAPGSAEQPSAAPPGSAEQPSAAAPGRAAQPAAAPGRADRPARGRRRSARARLGALLALLVAIAAVIVLLLRGPLRSSSTPKALAPPVVRVLIPEGKTRAQIAQIAAAKGLTGSYRAASRRSALLNPIAYGAPASTPDLEGFLFPATYDMYVHAPAARLVEAQLQAFKERFGVEDVERARTLRLTPYQLLIVASMVEREARVPGDRAKIAAVIYNRLRLGMPLGVDATIYYAIEQRTGIATYTRELSEAQLHLDSPYNTRTHVGLPPTPISNPGQASIEAAAHPAHVPYLYYVLAPDGCGEHVFSTTLAEFEVDDAAYHAALAKHGGHLPACKVR